MDYEEISKEEENELLCKLYEHIGRDIENLSQDVEEMTLTCNCSSSGETYFWYADELQSVAIDMYGDIIDESEPEETLEGILY